MKPSFQSDYLYTYSVLNEPELHRFVVVVYRRPADPLKINQQEVGRAFITGSVMLEAQINGSSSGLIQAYFDSIVKEYENSLQEKVNHELTDNFILHNDDGTAVPEPMQSYLKKTAVQDINAELSGYLGALGINVDSAMPTGAMSALVKKAAELKKAQIESRPNQGFLLQELTAMKQSFKETATKAAAEKKFAYPLVKPATNYWPQLKNAEQIISVNEYGYEDNYWDDPEPEKPVKPVINKFTKKVIKVRAQSAPAFAETVRKFRVD